MSRIFKNLLKYWKADLIILVFLFVQAWCDLSLPQYTSDIIDVGIQNQGVEHILPEAMTAEEYELARVFMTEEEAALFEESYRAEGELYKCTVEKESELNRLDEKLSDAILFNYQMMSVDKETLLQMTSGDQAVQGMTQPGMETAEGYVDIRPMLASMLESGQLTKEELSGMRVSMQSMTEAMGSSMVQSMGVAYAVKCNTQAGLNMEKIQTDYLWMEGLKMLGIALIMGVATVAVGFFASKVGAGIGRDLRGKVFRNVVGFSNAEMDRFSTASLITRCTNDVQQVQMVSVMLLRMVAYAPIMGIGGVLKVIQTGANMWYIIALALLVILGFVGVLVAVAMPKFQLMQKLVDRVNLVSREILTGLSVIRAFGREKKEEERFDDANKALTKTMLFTNRVMTFMMPGMMLIMNILTIVIVWVSAHRIDQGVLQVGAMTAFITYVMQIVMSFLILTMMSIMLPRAAVAADRIEEVIRTTSSIHDPQKPEVLMEHKGVVEFDHVNFRYPGADADVLSDIDFTAKPGEVTAIIGSTGCGKSTLVNLIPRLYDVTGGEIRLDGVDIRKLSMKELREELGFVPQKAVLFSGTIASNLRFGNRHATDEEIAEAAQIAQATEFIEEKKDRYDSHIAQGGTNVSGGQKQRLSIARAIAKKPKVFIFDDSFSALDLKTDAALRRELAKKVKDSTVLIVAQRISTIMNADQILVLDEGRIVGKGTHKELLSSCEVYRQIAKSQLSEKEMEA